MMLPKLIATLLIKNSPAAVRVIARSQRTPVTTPSITVEPLGRGRAISASLGRRLAGSLGGVGDDLIGVMQRRLRLRHVFADAGDGLHHRRLFVGRQAD